MKREKRILVIGCWLLMLSHLASFANVSKDYVPKDYVWTSQSRNSSESMPCGGHDIGMNVWVEQGDVLFYASQSGWFDENNTLLKAGRWRLHIEGNPFAAADFQQRLCLDEGCIYIKGGGTQVRLWVDVEQPVVFVTIQSQHTKHAELSYESWRYQDRALTKAECQQSSYKWVLPANSKTFADSIKVTDGQLTFTHKNREETVFDFTVDRERMSPVKSQLYNPIGGREMQGIMKAPGFRFTGTTMGTYAGTDFKRWTFSNKRMKSATISIQLSTTEPDSFSPSSLLPPPSSISPNTSKKRSAQWWHAFWQRSWIETDSDDPQLIRILRNYELMRYMLGCNAKGSWPSKFNGGLFTFDPVYVDSASAFTPDYRKWGGGTMTAQNQRLVYWPMLKSGDVDMMRAQFDTYLRMLPTAEAWTRHHWGHGGACFSEQIENSGLPNPAEYGKHKEGDDWGVERNAWLEYEWDTVLEFCQMIRLASSYDPSFDATPYDTLIRSTLRFFDEHYQYRARQRGSKALDGDGRLIIYPGSGCETYKMAYNPASTIAALRTVGTTSKIPDIPLRVIDGDTCIAPAVAWERIQNVETPQLYPVFPWRIYGVGRPHLNIARNTYQKDPHAVAMRSSKGWKQDNIWAACLGLSDEAKRLTLEKFADGPFRFPAFWEAGFDWAPDLNRGGSAMIGLQEMLLQEDSLGRPILFPAWPQEWPVTFRLHTSDGKVVEGQHKAALHIVKTLCNYQSEPMAIVDPQGRLRMGWQYLGGQQSYYQIQVFERITHRLAFDSDIVNSAQSQLVEIPMLPANTYGYYWRVRIAGEGGDFTPWSERQDIRIVPKDMKGDAQWIGATSRQAAHIPEGRWSNGVFKKDSFLTAWKDVDTLSARSIVVRKEFLTPRRVTNATVYVCGLGHYELTINDQKIGSSEFAPLWSEYSKTVYYNTFDVTEMINRGGRKEERGTRNVISVLLGNGFFNVQRGNRYSKLQTSFGPPQLLFRLDISYEDGSHDSILSDSSWTWTPSPITFNSIYGGESYDARMEETSPHHPSPITYHPVVITEGPTGTLRPETAHPVKVMEHYDVQSWKYIPKDSLEVASKKTKRQISPSVFVCDMGQNLAGFPEITVSGERGQKVTLIVSERLTPQGVCDQSQTGRQHFYEYTLRGGRKEEGGRRETWHPRFSYYGFRYIQVEGAVMEGEPNPEGLPVIHRLQSCFVYNSAPETSSFWCNNELFTRTHRLIERAERSNMQAVLTDCPHREKLGWLEQDHLCGPSLLFNYDMTRLIPKVIRDIVDTQKPNGFVPTTAPQYVSFGNLFDDSPEWGSTLIILPFQYYDMYGDSTLIVDNYEPMRRYVDYLTSRSEDGIVSHGLGDWYDYGPWRAGFSRNTPIPLVATAHYIYDLQLISRAALMTGHKADAEKYAVRYQEVVDAFNRHFYKPDSCYYGTGSQTSNALPLFLGICGEHKEAVLQNLIADIHAHGDRLTTGDVGNRYLFRVLADNGHDELLFRMLNHYETPGYGFQLSQGATTLTEQWDPRQGSSENHFMMGQIDEWLFRSISGLRQQPGTHGMRQLIINPKTIGDITRVKTTIGTLYGPVTVERNGDQVNVSVPGGIQVP